MPSAPSLCQLLVGSVRCALWRGRAACSQKLGTFISWPLEGTKMDCFGLQAKSQEGHCFPSGLKHQSEHRGSCLESQPPWPASFAPSWPCDDIWGPLAPSGKRCQTGKRGQAAVAGEQVMAGGCAVQESPAGPADVQLFISSLLECKCQLPSPSPCQPWALLPPPASVGLCMSPRTLLGWAPSSSYSTAPPKRQRQAGKGGEGTTARFNEGGTLSPSSSSF